MDEEQREVEVPEELSEEGAVLSDDAFDDAAVEEDEASFTEETTDGDPDDMGLDIESYD